MYKVQYSSSSSMTRGWRRNRYQKPRKNQQPMVNGGETIFVHLTKAFLKKNFRYLVLLHWTKFWEKPESLLKTLLPLNFITVRKFFNVHVVLLCASYVLRRTPLCICSCLERVKSNNMWCQQSNLDIAFGSSRTPGQGLIWGFLGNATLQSHTYW